MNLQSRYKPIVVFEQLSPQYKWLIKWYFFRRYDVYFLRLDNLSNEDVWIRKYINAGYLKKINFDFMLGMVPGFYYDMAFDNVHNFFKSLKEDAIVGRINKLYNDNDINGVFMKLLNERLARFYYLNFVLNKLKKTYPKKRIIFIPTKYLDLKKVDCCEICDYQRFYKEAAKIKADFLDTSNIRFSLYAITTSYLGILKRKIFIIFKILGFPLWLLKARTFNRFKKMYFSNSYEYAIMITSPRRQFNDNIRKVDFLIDDRYITRDKTIFLVYKKLSKENKSYMKRNNLTYIDDLDSFVSFKYARCALPYYLFLLTSSIRENIIILEIGLFLIYYYIKWQGFSEHVHVNNLVTYSDFSNQAIVRNLILRQHNCKIYYYIESANFPFFCIKKDSPFRYRAGIFAFCYCDYFISLNEKITDYFKSSYFNFKFYKNIGFLWAEQVKLIKEGRIKSDFKKELHRKGYKEGMKLITVFDSTLHEEGSAHTYQDGIEFLNGILRLLEEAPFIFIVLKEKRFRKRFMQQTAIFSEILKMYNILEGHPRCYCLKVFRGPSPTEIIAFNDLTVAFPFSSPALEALSARKKAFWYDATGKFRDTFYDSTPGLVCHSYKELKDRVHQLLYNTTDQEYNEYLDRFIKGKIEPYLDGKAITRFREFLTESGSRLEAQYDKG